MTDDGVDGESPVHGLLHETPSLERGERAGNAPRAGEVRKRGSVGVIPFHVRERSQHTAALGAEA
jgi:hypothetical protein